MRSRSRGSTLLIALVVLAIAAVLALGAAQGAVLSLRISNVALARLRLRAIAENALERALASDPPGPRAPPVVVDTLEGDVRVRTELRRDLAAGITAPPFGGFSVSTGDGGFGAEHYIVRSTAETPRGERVIVEQRFHLVIPGGP